MVVLPQTGLHSNSFECRPNKIATTQESTHTQTICRKCGLKAFTDVMHKICNQIGFLHIGKVCHGKLVIVARRIFPLPPQDNKWQVHGTSTIEGIIPELEDTFVGDLKQRSSTGQS